MVTSSRRTPSVGESGPVDPAPRPTRRTFTAEYKARIVAEYEAALHGEKSAVLRREGLFHTHVREWLAARDPGALAGLDRASSTSGRRQRRFEVAELDRLRAENQRLSEKFAQTQAALADHGKSTRALGESGRDLGTVERVARVEQVMEETFTALTGAGLPVKAAYHLIGRARASHYRRAGRRSTDPDRRVRRARRAPRP